MPTVQAVLTQAVLTGPVSLTGPLAVATLGFTLGLRHATDPDHVIAVTTIVTRQRTAGGAAAVGAAWGVGHTITILVVGSGIIIFGWVIPPRVGLLTEFGVGLMLIGLGLVTLASARRPVAPGSPATAHAQPHAHPHATSVMPLGWLDRRFGALGSYRLVRPLIVGVVHGLAGSAAVALLVLTTIRDPKWAVLYLLIFALGTVVGMMIMTAVIVLPFAYSTNQLGRLNSALRIASGVLSLAFGLFIAYRIGIVDGLLTGHSQ